MKGQGPPSPLGAERLLFPQDQSHMVRNMDLAKVPGPESIISISSASFPISLTSFILSCLLFFDRALPCSPFLPRGLFFIPHGQLIPVWGLTRRNEGQLEGTLSLLWNRCCCSRYLSILPYCYLCIILSLILCHVCWNQESRFIHIFSPPPQRVCRYLISIFSNEFRKGIWHKTLSNG